MQGAKGGAVKAVKVVKVKVVDCAGNRGSVFGIEPDIHNEPNL